MGLVIELSARMSASPQFSNTGEQSNLVLLGTWVLRLATQ